MASLWGSLPQTHPQSNKTYLSANPGILSRVKASLIQLITDDRLWQGFQENEQSFSHRVITASWIDLSQGKRTPGKRTHLICSPQQLLSSSYSGHSDPNRSLIILLVDVHCRWVVTKLIRALGGLGQLQSQGNIACRRTVHTVSVPETSPILLPVIVTGHVVAGMINCLKQNSTSAVGPIFCTY